LNKHWARVSEEAFWYEMDIPATQNAIIVSGFSKEMENWIWEIKREPFSIF
jgi:hypothetical protein